MAFDGAQRLTTRTNSGGTTLAYGYDGSSCNVDKSGAYAAEERVFCRESTLRIMYNASSNPTLQFVVHNTLGSALLTTDASGNTVTACTAGLYGTNPSPATAEYNYEGSEGYRFNTTSLDGSGGASSAYVVGARVYDPSVGRFLQQDPLSFGMGDYTYVGNSPANAVDPTGEIAQSWFRQ